ncbi:4-sulfomuconolactone hydrolase [compost metagenome]
MHALLEAFGADACVWGSDWPFIRQRSRVDYGPLLKLAERLMPDARLRQAVMWDTPRRLFGFA